MNLFFFLKSPDICLANLAKRNTIDDYLGDIYIAHLTLTRAERYGIIFSLFYLVGIINHVNVRS